GQDEEDGLERVVHVARVFEHVATDPQDHGPVTGHERLERPLTSLVATPPEPLQQLAIGEAGASAGSEQARKVVAQRARRGIWHPGDLLVGDFRPSTAYSAPEAHVPIQDFPAPAAKTARSTAGNIDRPGTSPCGSGRREGLMEGRKAMTIPEGPRRRGRAARCGGRSAARSSSPWPPSRRRRAGPTPPPRH